jgi:hypothetical protein
VLASALPVLVLVPLPVVLAVLVVLVVLIVLAVPQSTHFKFVLIHCTTYEHMHLLFLIRRMTISGILLLFDVVWLRTTVYPLSDRAECPGFSLS